MVHQPLSLEEQYVNWYKWLNALGAVKESLSRRNAGLVCPRRVVF